VRVFIRVRVSVDRNNRVVRLTFQPPRLRNRLVPPLEFRIVLNGREMVIDREVRRIGSPT
jgi:hypothetical protein